MMMNREVGTLRMSLKADSGANDGTLTFTVQDQWLRSELLHN